MFYYKNILFILVTALLLNGCSFDLTEQGIRSAERANRANSIKLNQQQCEKVGGIMEIKAGIAACRIIN